LLDLTELDLPSTMKTDFPDSADLLNFTLTITPDEGAFGVPESGMHPLNFFQACTKAAHSFSRLASTPITHMTLPRSSVRKR
jgi:hypothetical protein